MGFDLLCVKLVQLTAFSREYSWWVLLTSMCGSSQFFVCIGLAKPRSRFTVPTRLNTFCLFKLKNGLRPLEDCTCPKKRTVVIGICLKHGLRPWKNCYCLEKRTPVESWKLNWIAWGFFRSSQSYVSNSIPCTKLLGGNGITWNRLLTFTLVWPGLWISVPVLLRTPSKLSQSEAWLMRIWGKRAAVSWVRRRKCLPQTLFSRLRNAPPATTSNCRDSLPTL